MEQELKKIPKHLGLIIDGNGRWAKQRGLVRSMGHKKGFSVLEKMVKECFYTYGIGAVSVYAFSTENWNRPKAEVDYLMDIFRKQLKGNFEKKYPDVRFNLCGEIDGLPGDIPELARKLMDKTKDGKKYTLNMCINYSGQHELVHAVNEIIKEGITEVNKDVIAEHLYTCGQEPLDFIIRTSGEQRLSNFMLWQAAYAEFYFPKVHWPSFNKKHLHKALLEYQSRDRRFGAIKE